MGTQLLQALRILKHPVTGFWELRYENKAGIVTTLLMIFAAYFVTLGSELTTSYIFYPVENKFVDPFVIFIKIVVPFATWVVANYLVSSIMRGQGRLIDVLNGSAYALMPYILFTMPLAIVSNGLTLSEAAIYSFCRAVIYGWCAFLFFVSVREVHNYEMGETALNIFLSILFMLAIWILLVIFTGLTGQLFDFINQIWEEVSIR
ncbi:YIP1 family protein [Paenibacillus contaminans]|nr:YIP1 family protein [Paenibacillus contaminans]